MYLCLLGRLGPSNGAARAGERWARSRASSLAALILTLLAVRASSAGDEIMSVLMYKFGAIKFLVFIMKHRCITNQ